MLRSLCASAVLILTVGCMHTALSRRSDDPQVRDLTTINKSEWADYAGMTVRVVGVARDCKRSGALFTADESLVYVDDLSGWPTDLNQKLVEATGILIYHPKQEPPENGGAYITGPYYSLASATWAPAR